ncbi:MAG TPA: TetR/AcrR family transcriptional regulator, partial [Bacillota bacterium]|nr:TetR/AcrR family transcriptional regulator [Bacillota bacterium]
DVFENCIQTTRASFEWGKAKPEYGQYNRINMLMELDNSEFITKLRTASAEGVREMVERDKQRGLIKPEVDSALVVDMIYTLISREFFRTGFDEELFLKRITDVIHIIKEGIAS